MSELTPCNYCNLKSIKASQPEGSRIELVSNNGWIDVYVVPVGETLDTRQEPKTGNHLSKQWKASLMKVSDHCCC